MNNIPFNFRVSPRTFKIQTKKTAENLILQRKVLYRSRQQVKRLKKKVHSLESIVKSLRINCDLSSNAEDHLLKTFSAVPRTLIDRMLKLLRTGCISRKKYPEELRKFAITLHFYSAKGYDFVRKTFDLALPHPSIIRKWSSVVECQPGFLQVAFNALKEKVIQAAANKKKIVCSLLLDEMSIKKQIDYDGKRNWGYVDIGNNVDNDDLTPASEALVIMVVSHTEPWKLPIAYFLIKSLTGGEKANIVSEALIRLEEIGVEVLSVTCDGPSVHFTMFKHLGCNFDTLCGDNVKTHFTHPSNNGKKVFAVLDICHMLKLIRNALADLKIIFDKDGNEVKWHFIEKLHELQQNEGLLAANKLSKRHMEWRKQKMKVSNIIFRDAPNVRQKFGIRQVLRVYRTFGKAEL